MAPLIHVVYKVLLFLQDAPFFLALLSCLGFVLLLSSVFGLLGFFRRHLRSGKSLSRYGLKDGAYAVVTGASDGIGKEYAKQLAQKGFNVVLVSRKLDSLDVAVTEIQGRLKKQVTLKAIASDLSQGAEDAKNQLDQLNIDVGILVNNVGISYDLPAPYHELPLERVRAMVNLNVTAAAELTHWALPKMLDKKRGLIINVSSGSSLVPAPFLAMYSATKAFVNTFSEALAYEYRNSGIHVEAVTPFHVTTKLSKIRRKSLTVPDPAAFVRASLAKVGSGGFLNNPWFAHDVMGSVLALLPHSRAVSLVFGELKTTRKRALAKKAADEKKADAEKKTK